MEYQDFLTALSADEPHLARDLANVRTLEHVLAWMQATGRASAAVDLIAQDEFSHDFLVALEPEGKYLVFGMI